MIEKSSEHQHRRIPNVVVPFSTLCFLINDDDDVGKLFNKISNKTIERLSLPVILHHVDNGDAQNLLKNNSRSSSITRSSSDAVVEYSSSKC